MYFINCIYYVFLFLDVNFILLLHDVCPKSIDRNLIKSPSTVTFISYSYLLCLLISSCKCSFIRVSYVKLLSLSYVTVQLMSYKHRPESDQSVEALWLLLSTFCLILITVNLYSILCRCSKYSKIRQGDIIVKLRVDNLLWVIIWWSE